MEMSTASVGGQPAEVLDVDELGRLVVTPHPVTLDGQRNVAADLRPGESLGHFLDRHVGGIRSGAWRVSIGGREVPPSMWSRTYPKHGQVINCRATVGRSALALIAVLVLAYFTMGAGATLGGSLLGVNGLAMVGSAGLSVVNAAIFAAGSMIINKVLGPKIPKIGGLSEKQIYSITDQRNGARQYGPIGVLLGEMRVAPDLASRQYTWFAGDEQYLSSVLLGGINVHRFSDLAIGETPIASYSDVTVYANGFSGMPSVNVPLFSNADSLAGGTIDDDEVWTTRTSSVDAVQLQLDFEYTLFRTGKKGLASAFLGLEIQYRAVGASDWIPFGTGGYGAGKYGYTNKSTEVKRVTMTMPVDAGQYEVRVRQFKTLLWQEDATRTVQWVYLRTIQPDPTDYSGWGRIGLKIRASGQISGALDTLRATFHPRPLPVWNGTSWVTATTRAEGVSNPGALILMILRGIYDPAGNLQFGMGLTDEQIDVEGLKGFMLHCASSGFTYDRWLTEPVSMGDLLDEIALAGMGQFMWLDGSRPTVMWAANGQPIGGVVNMANMLRGTFQVSYSLANAADGIEYQYLDRDKGFETVTLRVPAPGVTTMTNPARLEGRGVTTEAQAAVLARYHLAQSLYQYKDISFGADLEHLDYRRLSMLSLSHDMTRWAYGGRLAAATRAGGQVVLTLDEPVPALATRYVGLRVPGEIEYRVFPVQAFTGPSTVITLQGSWPAGVPFPGEGEGNPAHDTLWCYDFKATPGYRVRVVSIEPEADLMGATVRVVPESDEFWTYVLTGDYEPAPAPAPLPELDAPSVSNVRVTPQTNTQGNTEWTQFNVVWDSTGDLDHCQVWAAIDGRQLELRDGNALGNRTSFRIDENGSWLVRVIPFDSKGRAGEASSVLYVMDAVDAAPWNVDQFALDEVEGGLRRFRFGYSVSRPPAYAGVQIRYRAGLTPISVGDWDSLTPIGELDDVYTAAFETTKPPAGTYVFACRAITTAGALADGVATLTRTLEDAFGNIDAPDLTPPPTPTNVEVTAGFAKLIIEHDTPTYTTGHGHQKTKVYGKAMASGDPLPVFAAASPLFEFTGPISSYPAPLGTTLRLWLTWVSVDGVESETPAGGTNGIEVTTGKIGNADLGPLIIEAGNLANEAVTAVKISDNAITAGKLAANSIAVGTAAIQAGAIVNAMIATATIDSAKIANVSADKILAGALSVGRYLRSTNYVPLGAGWQISADGSAEFSSVTIRGNSYFDGQVTMRNPDGSIAFQSGSKLSWSVVSDVGKPRALTVSSHGYDRQLNTLDTGIYVDGSQIWGFGGGFWNIVLLNPVTLAVQDAYTFGGPSPNNGDGAAAFLNGYFPYLTKFIVCVLTDDNPQAYVTGALLAALKRCGASDAGLGSSAFRNTFRSAYAFIGQMDTLPGTGIEVFSRISQYESIASATIVGGRVMAAQKDLSIDSGNVSTYIADATIPAAKIGSLSVGLISTGINGGTANGIQVQQNILSVFTDAGAEIITLGRLS